MTGENVIVQDIFVRNFGNRPCRGGTRVGGAWLGPSLIILGNWVHLDLSRPCPAPIRSIPEIYIKSILYSDIFPSHSSSLMTLGRGWLILFISDIKEDERI